MEIRENLAALQNRILQASRQCNRHPDTIRLVAVSKTVSKERVSQAIAAGATIFGENYIQEAREKIDALSSHSVSWHFIGHLQSNKAKYAVRLFDLIHSVDSLKLARELNKESEKINKIQKILIQVNVGKEESKSGIRTEDAVSLIEDISKLPHLSIRGLMTIPPFFDAPEAVRPYFLELRDLFQDIRRLKIPNLALEELSMGMSGDFETAIQCGATLVRIGTAVFGRRQ